MVGLSESWQEVLEALVAAPAAWLTPAQVAGALGREVEETTDLLCDLDLAGWIEVCDSDPAPIVSLSPLGAERLGVKLVETGREATPRWAPAGEPEPPAPRPRHVFASARAASLDFVTDPSADPVAAAERGERAAAAERSVVLSGEQAPARASARGDDLPAPSVLLGVGLTPWPGPGQSTAPDATCPVCGSRRLGPHMYCLYCDRWGLDRLAPQASRPPGPARPPRLTPADPVVEQVERGRLRDRRRAKRLKHHQLQAEAQRRRRGGPAPDALTSPVAGSRPGC